MSMLKSSMLNGIAVSVKVVSALVLNKLLSIYVGPAGYAIVGQFQNVVAIIVSLAGGVLSTGVTKATAQHYDDESKQQSVWHTAIKFSLIASLVTGFSLLFIGDLLSEWLLHRSDMTSVFICLSLTLPAMAANNLLLAIVNGKKEIRVYVIANIIGSIFSMVVTGFLAYEFGLLGVLIAFTINPAVTLLASVGLVYRMEWFNTQALWGTVDRDAARELAGFGFMAVTSALMAPLMHMLVREHLAMSLGMAAAGYWQAIWKISEIYLMLITSTLAVYYLPRIAEIRTARELKSEIGKVYRFLLPLTVFSSIVIFLLRDFIIFTLFTKEFVPMRELFFWQLIGDVIKMCSWILGYVLIGRSMVKFFVVKEIVVSLLFVFLTILFVGKLGLQGVAVAYALTYSVNFVLLFFIVRYEMREMDNQLTLKAGLNE